MRQIAIITAIVLTSMASFSYAADDAAKVTISGFQFSPAKITVKKGTTVTFANEDAAPHTVTPENETEFTGTARILKGETVQIKFDHAGVQKYHCAIHPSMTGEVIVK
jgi:plastocyanin